MAHNPETLDKWRKFFQTSDSEIFDIIENAILVAAKDFPQNFLSRRDKIAEVLFSFTKCDRDHAELSIGGSEEECKSGLERENGVLDEGVSKNTTKVISSGDDQVMGNAKQISDCSVKALSDELEEHHQILNDVLRIKKIFEREHEESESVLLDSLRRLQLMDISVDILNATKIGKTVNLLRKHRLENIHLLSKTLIRSWKSMVNDQWSITTKVIAEAANTPESVNPPGGEEEEGLPSPPLDEGAFFLSQPTGLDLLQLSNFFDGMDDDGNPHQSEELNKNLDLGPAKINKTDDRKKPERKMKKQVSNGTKIQQKAEKGSIQKRSIAHTKEGPKGMDHALKLKATKRKLYEDYQQVQNAKKQRTTQMMDLSDISKQGLGNSNHANQNRHFEHC